MKIQVTCYVCSNTYTHDTNDSTSDPQVCNQHKVTKEKLSQQEKIAMNIKPYDSVLDREII